MRRVLPLAGAALLTACATAEPTRNAPYVFPDGLKVMGERFPYPDGPCRLLGETFATSELLDDSANLVGCPSDAMDDPRITSVGHVVGRYEGVVLISVPKSAVR